jgi:hypothetical protein
MTSNRTLVILLVILVIVILGTAFILLGPQIFPIYHHAVTY